MTALLKHEHDQSTHGRGGRPVGKYSAATQKSVSKAELVIVSEVLRKAKEQDEDITEWLTLHKSNEDQLAGVIADYLEDQREAVIRRAKAGARKPRQLVPAGDGKEMAAALNDTILEMVRAGAKSGLKRINRKKVKIKKDVGELVGAEGIVLPVPDEVFSGALEGLAEFYSSGYWTTVSETTQWQVSAMVSSWVQSGEPIGQLVRDLKEFHAFGPDRAWMIARTETTRALGAGHWALNEALIADDDVGVVGQEWSTTMDSRAREDHISAHGQQIIGAGETFDIGGYAARFPGDPMLPADQTINCRCTTLPVMADEVEKSWQRGVIVLKHADHDQSTHGRSGGGASLSEAKEWAKGSKLNDKDGNPPVLHRGSRGGFGPHGGEGEGGMIFVGQERIAEQYAEQYSDGEVKSFAVKADNPIDISRDSWELFKEYRAETGAESYSYQKTDEGIAVAWTEERPFRDWLDNKGIEYDAIYFAENDGSRSLAVKSKSQLLEIENEAE